jgi:hypothetical protein
MRYQSLRPSAIRALLVIACVQGIISCEGPTDPDGKLVGDASYIVVPTGLVASPVSWSEIALSWPRPSNASTGYEVYRSTTGEAGPYSQIGTALFPISTYNDAGLTGSTQYCYQVRSYKIAGKNKSYSGFSSAACATTLVQPLVPIAPSGTSVVPQNSQQVRISWTDNSADETEFRIERSGVPTGPWSFVGTQYPNTPFSNQYTGSEHQACYRVIAVNVVGPSPASEPDCTTPPAGPTTLSTQAADQQSLDISWQDNSEFEDGFEVSRLNAAGAWIVIGQVAANAIPSPSTVTYHDAGLSRDVSYSYIVRALKDGGYSDYSYATTGVIPSAAPAAPGSPHATYSLYYEDWYSYWYFTLSWSDNSNNEQGFRIEWAPDRSGGWIDYATTGANATSFETYYDTYDAYPDGGCYKVTAFNSLGTADAANITCAEPGSAPYDLTATGVDQQSIDLSWTDNAGLELGYKVFRSTDPYGQFTLLTLTPLPANANSYHDAGLTTGQLYWYLVEVMYDDTEDWNNYSNFASAAPAMPTAGLTASGSVIARGTRSIKVGARVLRPAPAPTQPRTRVKPR